MVSEAPGFLDPGLPRMISASEASRRTRQDMSRGPVPLEFILYLFSSFSSNFPLLK